MPSPSTALPDKARQLIERFSSRQASVGVIGLGYVGLPLAVTLANAGFHVVGIDLTPEKVAQVRAGESYIEDVPSEDIRRLISAGKLEASTSFDALARVDGVSICVPTPLRKTGDPDLTFIISATQALRPHLHAGMVVILESTTYPGTTREMLLPELQSTGPTLG